MFRFDKGCLKGRLSSLVYCLRTPGERGGGAMARWGWGSWVVRGCGGGADEGGNGVRLECAEGCNWKGWGYLSM